MRHQRFFTRAPKRHSHADEPNRRASGCDCRPADAAHGGVWRSLAQCWPWREVPFQLDDGDTTCWTLIVLQMIDVDWRKRTKRMQSRCQGSRSRDGPSFRLHLVFATRSSFLQQHHHTKYHLFPSTQPFPILCISPERLKPLSCSLEDAPQASS